MGDVVAVAAFDWAVLQTGLLAPWVGWMAVGWSLLWIAGHWVVGISAVAAVYPTVYGVGRLASQSRSPANVALHLVVRRVQSNEPAGEQGSTALAGGLSAG